MNILNMVRKGKEDMASVRKSSLHRGERPDEDVKPVSDTVRIVWFLLTVPFVLLSFEIEAALAYMLANVKSHTHIEVMVILLAMPLTVCVPLSFAAIAFFPSERIRRPDKWMKYWYWRLDMHSVGLCHLADAVSGYVIWRRCFLNGGFFVG